MLEDWACSIKAVYFQISLESGQIHRTENREVLGKMAQRMRGTRGSQLFRSKINTIITEMMSLNDELLNKHSKTFPTNTEQKLRTLDLSWVILQGAMAGHRSHSMDF